MQLCPAAQNLAQMLTQKGLLEPLEVNPRSLEFGDFGLTIRPVDGCEVWRVSSLAARQCNQIFKEQFHLAAPSLLIDLRHWQSLYEIDALHDEYMQIDAESYMLPIRLIWQLHDCFFLKDFSPFEEQALVGGLELYPQPFDRDAAQTQLGDRLATYHGWLKTLDTNRPRPHRMSAAVNELGDSYAAGRTFVLKPVEPLRVTEEELATLAQMEMRPLVREILTSPELKPTTKVISGGWTFYTSRVFMEAQNSGKEYLIVLALVPVIEANGTVVLKRRFFMRSHSGGSWRTSPYRTDGRFSKGKHIHYTAETEPTPDIKQHLTALVRSQEPLLITKKRLFDYLDEKSPLLDSDAKKSLVRGFDEEIMVPSVRHISLARQLGPKPFGIPWMDIRFSGQVKLRHLWDLKFPENFVPDFSKSALLEYADEHTLLGRIHLREYNESWIKDGTNGELRPLIWTMAEDENGRAWIQAIRFADSPVSSYGSYVDVLDSGVLTAKPLEYIEYGAMAPEPYRRDFNEEYYDMSHVWALLPPIRAYRRARGLPEINLTGPHAEPVEAFDPNFWKK